MNVTAATVTGNTTREALTHVGVWTTITITDRDLRIVNNLRALMLEANADDRDAFQHAGFLYGNLHTALMDFLARILDSRAAAAQVNEHLLDHYGDSIDGIRAAVCYGLTRYADEYALALTVVWSE